MTAARGAERGPRSALPGPLFDVTLWTIDLSTAPPLAEPERVLAPAEMWRAERLLRPADRRRALAAAYLLRAAASTLLQIPPRRVSVRRRCHCGSTGHGRAVVEGLGCSVSHSGDLVMVGVTSAPVDVGVDVEEIRGHDAEPIGEFLLAPGEQTRTVAQVLALWCRKEAVVKATGDGLLVALREIRLGDVGDGRWQVRAYRGQESDAYVTDVCPRPGYVAAVACLQGDFRLAFRDGRAVWPIRSRGIRLGSTRDLSSGLDRQLEARPDA